MKGSEIFYGTKSGTDRDSQREDDNSFFFALAGQPIDREAIFDFLAEKRRWYARGDAKREMRWLIRTKDLIEGLHLDNNRRDHLVEEMILPYRIQHGMAKELIVERIDQLRESPSNDATTDELSGEDKTPTTSTIDANLFVAEPIARQILSGNPERPLSKATFYKLVRSGKITAYSPTPGRRVYSRSEILAYINSQQSDSH